VKAVFADTSYYVAMTSPRDSRHDSAVAFSDVRRERIVTTEYVLVELGNYLARGPNRPLFVGLFRHLQADPETLIIRASEDLLQKGLDLYENRPDKAWSLTDCISFIVMREHGLTEALTGDRHFEQAGFKALLA
jgi:predicted nucleic acid-binding protein